MDRPKIKLVGVLAHGHVADFWLVEEDQPHGSNLTIEVLARTLEKIYEKSIASGSGFPTHLWIQCDNTAAENKNQLVLRFVSMLVDKRVFRSATMSFMRVGHTHEDIGDASETKRTPTQCNVN